MISSSNNTTYKLGELCEKIGSGVTPRGGDSVYQDNGIALIRSQNVYDFSFSEQGLVYIDEEQATKMKNVEVKSNDVLLNITGDSVTRCCIAPENIIPARVNQHVAIIRSKRELLDSKYLLYWINYSNTKELLLSLSSTGATRKALTKGMIENLDITLPKLAEQKAIAAILFSLDNKIELNNRINKNLEKMAQAIFKSWFVDFELFQDGEFEDSELGRIPKGWRVGSLDECINFYNGYAFKSKELLDNEGISSYRVFKMGHIKKGGGLNYEGTKSWIAMSDCRYLEKYVLKKGDLLMCMTDMKGNVALLGHTALMNEDDRYIVNQRVGLIRANNDFGIDFPYLYILTNSRFFIENLRGRANSGVQVNLSTNEIKASKVVIAPKEVNQKFNDIVLPMFYKIFDIIKENQLLTATRDSILPKLMSGEIRVPTEEVQ